MFVVFPEACITHALCANCLRLMLEDSAYPPSPWLMKLFPEGTRDPDEIIHYNKEVSSAALLLLSLRVKVEWAFGLF